MLGLSSCLSLQLCADFTHPRIRRSVFIEHLRWLLLSLTSNFSLNFNANFFLFQGNSFVFFIATILFLEPYPPLNVAADVTSKDITVRWNYNTDNNKKFPIIDYGLWYQESGGTAAEKKMTWSNIANDTGPPIVLSYTFQDFLKPYTNYSIRVRGYNQYDSKSSSKVSVETHSTGIQISFMFLY